MSTQYDQLKKSILLAAPETVNSDWASESKSLDDRFGAFSLFLKYENGVTPDIEIKLQMSMDNETWADIEESKKTFTDTDGSILYDINGSGTQYIRIAITVNAGSIDVVDVRYTAGQFH